MTTKEFMSGAVNYYKAAYNPHQHAFVKSRLANIQDKYKSDMLDYLIDTFSIRFRTPPGVSEIMEAYEIVKAQQPKHHTEKHCSKCGKQIFSDFCPNCDDYADTETEENKNLKDLFKSGRDIQEESNGK